MGSKKGASSRRDWRRLWPLAAAAAVVAAALLLGGDNMAELTYTNEEDARARLRSAVSNLEPVAVPDRWPLDAAVDAAERVDACSLPADWGGLGAVAALEESVRLGAEFMMEHQRDDGRFTYEYDWFAQTYTKDDSQVRQAGAAWGLALVSLHRPALESARVRSAAARALAFFEANSRTGPAGTRFVAYPGDKVGSLGTTALVTLAHVDLLRAMERAGEGSAPEARALYANLRQYVLLLVMAWRSDGSFHGSYSLADGAPFGAPSPYFDGETLLALVKATRYLGTLRTGVKQLGLPDPDWWRLLARAADAGFTRHVASQLEDDADSSQTKGYYQWSSMLYYELATAGRPPDEVDAARYAGYVKRLAAWMVDVHLTLKRRRNTGYAYEGITAAYALLQRDGEGAEAQRLGCVIDAGMRKLTGWQVAHPLSSIGAKGRELEKKARGGIQNHEVESLLRIDVAQHQVHAALLSLQHRYGAHSLD